MSRVVCDQSKCSGCLACVVACIDQHYEETQEDAVSPRLYEKKVFPSGLVRYETRSCRHCADAACPFDVPRFDAENQVIKCDGCAVRVACGLEPACVRACNTGALRLVP